MLRLLFILAMSIATLAHCRTPTGEPRYDLMIADGRQDRADYVRKYEALARVEHDLYGVPASLKMAQGLLECDAGTSTQAREANNHFGIKAKIGNDLFKLLAIGYRVYSEGKFACYASAWWSFRHHSKLLTSGSYAHIPKQCGNNYRGWAYAIKRVGYAQDKHYVPKITGLIDRYELWRLDGHRAPVLNPGLVMP